MANIAYKEKINTQEKYENVETLMEVTLTRGNVYYIQPIGCCTFCIATSLPQDGGTTIFNNNQCEFTLKSGENLYIRTWNTPVNINITE